MNPQTPQPDLFTRLGMVSASDEQKQKLAEQLADLTMVRVIAKLETILPPEKLAEVEKLIDEDKGIESEEALRAAVPDYDSLVQTTASEVADQLVADQQAVLAQARQMATPPASA